MSEWIASSPMTARAWQLHVNCFIVTWYLGMFFRIGPNGVLTKIRKTIIVYPHFSCQALSLTVFKLEHWFYIKAIWDRKNGMNMRQKFVGGNSSKCNEPKLIDLVNFWFSLNFLSRRSHWSFYSIHLHSEKLYSNWTLTRTPLNFYPTVHFFKGPLPFFPHSTTGWLSIFSIFISLPKRMRKKRRKTP